MGTRCTACTFVVYDSEILLTDGRYLTVSAGESSVLAIASVTVFQSIRAVAVDTLPILARIGITVVHILADILFPRLRLGLPNHRAFVSSDALACPWFLSTLSEIERALSFYALSSIVGERLLREDLALVTYITSASRVDAFTVGVLWTIHIVARCVAIVLPGGHRAVSESTSWASFTLKVHHLLVWQADSCFASAAMV